MWRKVSLIMAGSVRRMEQRSWVCCWNWRTFSALLLEACATLGSDLAESDLFGFNFRSSFLSASDGISSGYLQSDLHHGPANADTHLCVVPRFGGSLAGQQ